MSLEQNILSILECSVCIQYMVTSIYICHRGHNICEDCKEILENCPTCKEVLGSTRNYSLEKLASYLKYPCVFARDGCKVTLSATDLKMHQKNCPDHPRKCSFCPEGSVWLGHVSKMQAHLMEQHKSKILRTNTDMGLHTNFPMDCLLYDNAYKEMFHLFAGKVHGNDRDEIGYFVRYIGDKKHAKRFKFTLSIYSASQRFRNISISEICHDQDISFDDIIQSGSYIGLLESVLRSYCNAFWKFTITYNLYS